MPRFFLTLLAFAFSTSAYATGSAARTEHYEGEARDKKNAVVYVEKHRAQFDGSAVLSAHTDYSDASGKLIAEMESDFRQSRTVPNYTFRDLRDGSSHGIEKSEDGFTLWTQNKGQERKTKTYRTSDFSKDAVIVGCQGLHYNLASYLPQLREGKTVAIKYLIPGKLDYFSFVLSQTKEDDEFIYLKLAIQSVFLKLFAGPAEMKYAKKDLRLIEYSGFSNLPDSAGDVQNVQLRFHYPQEKTP